MAVPIAKIRRLGGRWHLIGNIMAIGAAAVHFLYFVENIMVTVMLILL